MSGLGRRFMLGTLWLTSLIGLGACRDSNGAGTTRLTVSLTDAPDAYLESATVEIGRVEIRQSEGSAVVLTESGGTFDLLTLQNGVMRALASLEIPSGTYHQLRLVVSSATVTLKEPYRFNDGSRTRSLTVPSGASSGLKINLSMADAEEGSGVNLNQDEMVLVADFDVSQSFVVQGNPESPAGINGYHFKPLIRAVLQDVAGTISGTITGPNAAGKTVKATLVSSDVLEEMQTKTATAVVATDGTYTIRFLSPGTYDVTVENVVTVPAKQTVELGNRENETGVNLTIQ